MWDARLRLRYRDAGERTLVASEHRGPLRVQKAFHPEGAPCHSILLHPPGGIAGGDALHIDVEVRRLVPLGRTGCCLLYTSDAADE